MASPSPGGVGTTEYWEAGFSRVFTPPILPPFGSGVIAAAVQEPGADTGAAITYTGSIFTSQSWSTGPPVPFLIKDLEPAEVRKIRDQIVDQLRGPGSGLDDLPLRAFVEVAKLYLEPGPSDRFTTAAFGTITQPSPGEYLGEVSWPGDITGTVLGTAQQISAESHLAAVQAGNPAPLREADLRSLVLALQSALAEQAADPQWQELLDLAEQALP